MIYLELFFSFFKLGLFGFGGGYAIIPLMEYEISSHGWLDISDFANIVSISQMTPGPIGINAATYVGYHAAPLGLLGSLIATLGMVLPSFIIVIAIANIFNRFSQHPLFQSILKGIRPVTIGLITSAVWFFAGISILTTKLSTREISRWSEMPWYDLFDRIHVSPGGVMIAIIIFVLIKKTKIHPIMAVVVSAALGVLLI